MAADGVANGGTAAWLYSTVHRRRLLVHLSARLHLWQRRLRERGTNGRRQATATTAMWPAVWHGDRPQATGPLPAVDGSRYAIATAEAK
ncbi:MAG TPA: hypothetical protein VK518_04880 [Puia sp.]|nr:hypothetical protein [Puia sp.]